MKCIVTGGQGFIGFNLCKQISRQGWDCLVIDDESTGKYQNKIKRFHYHNMTICGQYIPNIIKEYQPNVIFHLAAVPRVPYSIDEPKKTFDANVDGTVNLLESLRLHCPDTIFINSSSSSVYGGANVLPTPENHPVDPKSPYALQKWQSEEWCKMYSKMYGVQTLSLRYFNVFGPHSYFGDAYSTVLSAWLYHIYIDKNYQPFIEGDGKQTRDFTFVDNVVQANIAAIHSNIFAGESFNIGHGQPWSLLQCIKLIEEICGRKLEPEQKPDRLGDVKHTHSDISKARKHFGYNPVVDFGNQIKEMADWYKNGYPL